MPTPKPLPDVYGRIYRIVSRIPPGTVATYGQIADLAGVGPREVGRALRLMPAGGDCPWHRVINARGEVSVRAGSGTAHLRQERLLEEEGVVLEAGRIDLEVYRWYPDSRVEGDA